MKLLLLQMLGRNVVLVLKLAKAVVTEHNGRQVIANYEFYSYILLLAEVFLELIQQLNLNGIW